MPSLNSFGDTVLDNITFKPIEVQIAIDTKFYPTDYGINAKPLEVKVKENQIIKTFTLNDLSKMFGYVSFVVKEYKYKRLSRSPQVIVINPDKKEFNGHQYYDYRIRRLDSL